MYVGLSNRAGRSKKTQRPPFLAPSQHLFPLRRCAIKADRGSVRNVSYDIVRIFLLRAQLSSWIGCRLCARGSFSFVSYSYKLTTSFIILALAASLSSRLARGGSQGVCSSCGGGSSGGLPPRGDTTNNLMTRTSLLVD